MGKNNICVEQSVKIELYKCTFHRLPQINLKNEERTNSYVTNKIHHKICVNREPQKQITLVQTNLDHNDNIYMYPFSKMK